MSLTETYGMRYRGGPFDGDTLLVEPGTPLHAWPLVDRVEVEGGHYQKIGESQLSEAVPGLLRGAEYEWRPEADLPPNAGELFDDVAPSNLGSNRDA